MRRDASLARFESGSSRDNLSDLCPPFQNIYKSHAVVLSILLVANIKGKVARSPQIALNIDGCRGAYHKLSPTHRSKCLYFQIDTSTSGWQIVGPVGGRGKTRICLPRFDDGGGGGIHIRQYQEAWCDVSLWWCPIHTDIYRYIYTATISRVSGADR